LQFTIPMTYWAARACVMLCRGIGSTYPVYTIQGNSAISCTIIKDILQSCAISWSRKPFCGGSISHGGEYICMIETWTNEEISGQTTTVVLFLRSSRFIPSFRNPAYIFDRLLFLFNPPRYLNYLPLLRTTIKAVAHHFGYEDFDLFFNQWWTIIHDYIFFVLKRDSLFRRVKGVYIYNWTHFQALRFIISQLCKLQFNEVQCFNLLDETLLCEYQDEQ